MPLQPFILRVLVIFLVAAKVASAQSLPTSVELALKRAHIPLSGVAAYVQDVDGAKPLVAHNAAQAMNPASTMKLVTTYAALELLGPTYTWKTEAYAGGKLQGGVLQGDLILKGYGDPKLTLENFWLLLRRLRALGLREIRGDLVLDRSYFEPAEYDPAKFDAEPLRAYNVGPDALLLNFKAVRFLFVPDANKKTVTVVAEPKPAGLEFAAAVRATDGACSDWRAGIKADFQSNGASAKANFAGSMPASCGERYWNASLLAQPNYVYGVFRQLWEELGGTIDGGWKDGPVPADARLLATSESASNAELARDINKFSNNVMARQLFLTLGAADAGTFARSPRNDDAAGYPTPASSPSRSTTNLQQWLEKQQLQFPELVLENGAGLSRKERISAQHLADILQRAARSPFSAELEASLPILGMDGTVKGRFKESEIAGFAHLKTGSLEGVKSIAGYVHARSGKQWIMVFIINHPNAALGQPAQDALIEWLQKFH